MYVLFALIASLVAGAVAAVSIPARSDHSILEPVSHHVEDRTHLDHLTPASEAKLHYVERRTVNSDPAGSMNARLDSQFQYPTVVLDHSAHIQKAFCDSSFTHMTMTLGSPLSFEHVQENWSHFDKLLFLSAAPSCHAEYPGQYGYFVATTIHFDDETLTVKAYGEQVSAASAHSDMQLTWGEEANNSGFYSILFCLRQKFIDIRSLLRIPSSCLDNVVWLQISDFIICKSYTVDYAHYHVYQESYGLPAAKCGNGIDAALGSALDFMTLDGGNPSLADAQLASFAPNLGITFEEYMTHTNGTYKVRRSMVKRGLGSWLKKNIIEPAKKAIQSAASKVAGAIGSGLKAAAKFAVSAISTIVRVGLTGYTDSISLSIPMNVGPPKFMLDDSPWGDAYKILTYDEDGLSVNYGIDAASLAKLTGADQVIPTININGVEEVPKPSVTLFCVNCGMSGHLTTGGSATFSLLQGVTALSISLSGNLQAEINLGIDAYATYEIPVFSKRILTVGIPGLSIPDIFTVGPMLTLDVDSTIEVTALGQILSGVSYSWPKLNANLDIIHPLKSTSSGFAPRVAHNFNAMGSLNVLASLGLPVGVGVGFSLLNKYNWDAGLVDRPAIGANASWSGQKSIQSQAGSSSSSGSVNNGQCSGIEWDVLFYNQMFLHLGSSKYSLGEWHGPSLASGCLGGTPLSNCSNQGVQLAFSINTNGDNNGNDDIYYSNFDPTSYYGATPEYTSVASNAASFTLDGNGNWYPQGSTRGFAEDYFVLEYRGYLYAAMTGTYTFTVSNVDDIVLMWIGANAYSGFTRDNANILYTYQLDQMGDPSNVYSQNLVRSQYYPFRIMLANAEGAGGFNIKVTAPDGTVILGPDTGTNPYLVQQSCDAKSAPPFPDWSNES